MSRDFKKLLKAGKRTIELISVGNSLIKNRSLRACLTEYSHDIQRTIAKTERRRSLTTSDEIIIGEFLAGSIQSAWSILCSDGSLGCLINL